MKWLLCLTVLPLATACGSDPLCDDLRVFATYVNGMRQADRGGPLDAPAEHVRTDELRVADDGRYCRITLRLLHAGVEPALVTREFFVTRGPDGPLVRPTDGGP